jgi:hypothetical protein
LSCLDFVLSWFSWPCVVKALPCLGVVLQEVFFSLGFSFSGFALSRVLSRLWSYENLSCPSEHFLSEDFNITDYLSHDLSLLVLVLSKPCFYCYPNLLNLSRFSACGFVAERYYSQPTFFFLSISVSLYLVYTPYFLFPLPYGLHAVTFTNPIFMSGMRPCLLATKPL